MRKWHVDVVRTYLGEGPETVEPTVEQGVVTLTGRVERWSTTMVVDRLVRQIGGVVEVRDTVGYDFDDSAILGTGIAFGVA